MAGEWSGRVKLRYCERNIKSTCSLSDFISTMNLNHVHLKDGKGNYAMLPIIPEDKRCAHEPSTPVSC
jgi:hypothetical protein